MASLADAWSFPVAGFSTFGELFGISINQTLSAIAFFDPQGQPFQDDFVDNFAIHYARYQNYFTRSKLNRQSMLNTLRSDIIWKIAEHLDFVKTIEGSLKEVSGIRGVMESIRDTVIKASQG